MTEAVIFDIDGTLIDSVDAHARSWHEIIRRFGKEVAFEDVRRQIGKGGDKLMPVFFSREEIDRHGDQIQRERRDLFQTEHLPHIRPFPKVRDLFEQLRADGKRIVLASSAKQDELKQYQEIAGIADLVEQTTSSDEVEQSKPAPDIFEAALGKLGSIDKARVVVVGDTPYDAEAAGKAGLATVGVLCGGFPEADLRRAGCATIYRDPADLLAHYHDSPLS